MPSAEERQEWGQALRQARLDAGLEVDDVARRLNLRASFVQAVEEGRGGDHMDWSYERNHLRSMAAMVGITLMGLEVRG